MRLLPILHFGKASPIFTLGQALNTYHLPAAVRYLILFGCNSIQAPIPLVYLLKYFLTLNVFYEKIAHPTN